VSGASFSMVDCVDDGIGFAGLSEICLIGTKSTVDRTAMVTFTEDLQMVFVSLDVF
jgi:hypothetical protein